MPEEPTQTPPQSSSEKSPSELKPGELQMKLIYSIVRSTKIDCNCEICQIMREVSKYIGEMPPVAGLPKTP